MEDKKSKSDEDIESQRIKTVHTRVDLRLWKGNTTEVEGGRVLKLLGCVKNFPDDPKRIFTAL